MAHLPKIGEWLVLSQQYCLSVVVVGLTNILTHMVCMYVVGSMYKCIVRMLIADAESFPTQKYIVMGWYLLMEYAEITLYMGLTPK